MMNKVYHDRMYPDRYLVECQIYYDIYEDYLPIWAKAKEDKTGTCNEYVIMKEDVFPVFDTYVGKIYTSFKDEASYIKALMKYG